MKQTQQCYTGKCETNKTEWDKLLETNKKITETQITTCITTIPAKPRQDQYKLTSINLGCILKYYK